MTKFISQEKIVLLFPCKALKNLSAAICGDATANHILSFEKWVGLNKGSTPLSRLTACRLVTNRRTRVWFKNKTLLLPVSR